MQLELNILAQKVMIDEDLASRYHVETKRLNEQVKRNMQRFPKDFMFTLTHKEFENLKSQNATSSWGEEGSCQMHLQSKESQCYRVF
jgi:hypothetical protein